MMENVVLLVDDDQNILHDLTLQWRQLRHERLARAINAE